MYEWKSLSLARCRTLQVDPEFGWGQPCSGEKETHPWENTQGWVFSNEPYFLKS